MGMPMDSSEKFGSVLAGLHFTLILCAYDGLLTLVELNHSALLPDLSSSGISRTRYTHACTSLDHLNVRLGI
jgi:hypothetical protein